jgi:hypothetical protein
MTKRAYALIILAFFSGPAFSQTRGESVSTGSPHYFGHLFKGDTLIEGPEPRRCLVRIKTGRTECRSMKGWRRLARKIDEARLSGQERQETP